MTKDVWVTITGVQQDNAGETDITKTSVRGQYYLRGENHYVLYEETDENSGEKRKNRLKWNKDRLELTRKGTTNSRMIFEVGKSHEADYVTPFGAIPLEVATSRILFWEEEGGMRLEAEYELWTNQERLSKCELTVSVRAV